MHLHETLSDYWWIVLGRLFPWLEEELGPLTEKQKQRVTVLEADRVTLARAFVVNSDNDGLATIMVRFQAHAFG
jgi:hypothetical protein